jgi:hypothetical protein
VGVNARHDKVTNYFRGEMEDTILVDLEPIKMMPTYRNNKLGDARVSKRR